jgi:hypothetical protein
MKSKLEEKKNELAFQYAKSIELHEPEITFTANDYLAGFDSGIQAYKEMLEGVGVEGKPCESAVDCHALYQQRKQDYREIESLKHKLTASEARVKELEAKQCLYESTGTAYCGYKDTAKDLEQKLAAQEMEIEILKSIDVFCASGMTQIQFADKKWCINQGETWRPQLTKESK